MSEWKSYELETRRYPSTAFYETTPPKYGLTVVTAVIFAILTIVVVVTIYLLLRYRRRPCNAPPKAPTDVSAGYLSASQFIVQWNPIDNAESYTVYVGQITRFPVSAAVSITTTRNTRATITGLTINRNYYISATATNSCGESPLSPEITFFYVE